VNAQIGHLAAFGTALCWAVSAIYFTRASSPVGGGRANHARVLLALPTIVVLHLAVRGQVFPTHLEAERWGWLALSGVIGLALGDSFLFSAFVLIGPRLSLLIMSMVPIIGTTAAWIVLGETLNSLELAGVIVAVGGIGWVVMERSGAGRSTIPRRYAYGVLLSLAAACGQALGLVAAKKGMEGHFPAISAHVVRMLAAAIAMWAFACLRGRAGSIARAIWDRGVLVPMAIAVVLGSTLGIWLSLVSVQHARLGVAATIMALPPVLILPLAYWQLHERITHRAILGTVVSFAGIAMLLMG